MYDRLVALSLCFVSCFHVCSALSCVSVFYFLGVFLWGGFVYVMFCCCFFFSSRRRHTRCLSDWSSDVCSSDLAPGDPAAEGAANAPAPRLGTTTCSPSASGAARLINARSAFRVTPPARETASRSEEHTSELQSLRHLVCRLLLEKKKKRIKTEA